MSAHILLIKVNHISLASVAQWIERRPAKQKFAGSIPDQGTRLGHRPGPQLGAYRGSPLCLSCIGVSLSFSLPFSLNK